MLLKSYFQGQKWIFKHPFLAFLSSSKLTLNGNETGNTHKQFVCRSFPLVPVQLSPASALISDRQKASQTIRVSLEVPIPSNMIHSRIPFISAGVLI